MKKNFVMMAIIAISTLATVNVNAQDSAAVLSNNELRARYISRPYEADVKFHSAGQDVDVLTISRVDEYGDSTVYFKLRPYTGFRFNAELGFSADWQKNGEDRFGAAVNIGLGYVRRSWGFDFFAGLNGLGKEKGLMQLSLQPFYTPLRWGNDQNRFDIGLIGGVQQASASSAVRFEDSNSWSNQRLSTNLPRLCGGAFFKLAHRQFMGGHEFGVKISAIMYMPTSHYSHHSSVVENGKEEEVLDKKSRFENAHVQLQVSLTWSFCTGKVKKNY